MIDIGGKVINLAQIVSAEVETRQGPASQLVVKLVNGSTVVWEHSNNFDAFEALDRIKVATKTKITAVAAPAPAIVQTVSMEEVKTILEQGGVQLKP